MAFNLIKYTDLDVSNLKGWGDLFYRIDSDVFSIDPFFSGGWNQDQTSYSFTMSDSESLKDQMVTLHGDDGVSISLYMSMSNISNGDPYTIYVPTRGGGNSLTSATTEIQSKPLDMEITTAIVLHDPENKSLFISFHGVENCYKFLCLGYVEDLSGVGGENNGFYSSVSCVYGNNADTFVNSVSSNIFQFRRAAQIASMYGTFSICAQDKNVRLGQIQTAGGYDPVSVISSCCFVSGTGGGSAPASIRNYGLEYSKNEYNGRPFLVPLEFGTLNDLGGYYDEEKQLYIGQIKDFYCVNTGKSVLPEETANIGGDEYFFIPYQWGDARTNGSYDPYNYDLMLAFKINPEPDPEGE